MEPQIVVIPQQDLTIWIPAKIVNDVVENKV